MKIQLFLLGLDGFSYNENLRNKRTNFSKVDDLFLRIRDA